MTTWEQVQRHIATFNQEDEKSAKPAKLKKNRTDRENDTTWEQVQRHIATFNN